MLQGIDMQEKRLRMRVDGHALAGTRHLVQCVQCIEERSRMVEFRIAVRVEQGILVYGSGIFGSCKICSSLVCHS